MKIRTLALIMAASLVGLGSSPALASAPEYRGHGHSSYQHRGAYAGEITIDGCTTRIRKGGHVASQIVRAFRRAGYSACVRNGRVQVDFSECSRPRVRWCAESYSLSMRWGYDTVCMTPRYRASHPRPSRRYRPRVVRRWGLCS